MRHYSSVSELNKLNLRSNYIKIRKEFHRNKINESDLVALNLIKYLINKRLINNNLKIAIYWPMGSEICTKPALAALSQMTNQVSIASTEKNRIKFRLWKPNQTIVSNKLGVILKTKELKSPNVIVCPLVAFDENCNRLGRGGGYYDKVLNVKKGIIKIGYAYSIQITEKVPMNKHDIRMNAIITEKLIYENNT